jgi:hypothetical protein
MIAIKCKDKAQCCEYKTDPSVHISQQPLTEEELETVKRVSYKMPYAKACHLNYLLGLGKCVKISEFLENNKSDIRGTNRKDTQYMNINRYMDKKSYVPQAIKKPKKKGKKEQPDNKNELAQNECYNPCYHNGV